MALIPLTGNRGAGVVAIVDDHLASDVLRCNWYINDRGYVRNGRGQKLHRFVWELSGKDNVPFIDHANRNALDNRMSNLRAATRSQNNANRAMVSKSTGLKGVYPAGRRFCVIVKGEDGRSKRHGVFDSARDAARHFDEIATSRYGEFAVTNASMGLLD